MQKYILLRLFLFSIPVLYFYYDRKIALIVLGACFIYLAIFKFARFLSKSLTEKIKQKFPSFLQQIGGGRITKLLYLVATLFIVINSFQKDVAIFSITIALLYGFVSSFFQVVAKIKIWGKTLEGLVFGVASVYIVGLYLGHLLGLDKNVIVCSVIAAPLIEFLIRWPDENFSIPFFVAVVAQFVKNSF